MALAAVGHESSMQMAWRAAGWVGITTVGGAHFMPKRVERAVPTTARSASATPKDAAERATCVMK